MGILTRDKTESVSPDTIQRLKIASRNLGVPLDITLSRGTHDSRAGVSLHEISFGAFVATDEAHFFEAVCKRLDRLKQQIDELQAAIRSGR